MNPLTDYPIVIQQPVQWGEQDLFGHVNNVHFIRWFESSRVRYMTELGIAVSSEGVGPILASVHCNYQRQVKHPDTLTIGTGTEKIGNSSLTLQHSVWSEQQQSVVADGKSVVVMFDYQRQCSVPVSESIRTRIGELDAA